MEIKYPSTCTSPMERTAFLYRLYELLRLRHEEMGAKYRAKEINKQDWDKFLRWFDKRHDLFVADLLEARKRKSEKSIIQIWKKNEMKEDKNIVINLDAVFME